MFACASNTDSAFAPTVEPEESVTELVAVDTLEFPCDKGMGEHDTLVARTVVPEFGGCDDHADVRTTRLTIDGKDVRYWAIDLSPDNEGQSRVHRTGVTIDGHACSQDDVDQIAGPAWYEGRLSVRDLQAVLQGVALLRQEVPFDQIASPALAHTLAQEWPSTRRELAYWVPSLRTTPEAVELRLQSYRQVVGRRPDMHHCWYWRRELVRMTANGTDYELVAEEKDRFILRDGIWHMDEADFCRGPAARDP